MIFKVIKVVLLVIWIVGSLGVIYDGFKIMKRETKTAQWIWSNSTEEYRNLSVKRTRRNVRLYWFSAIIMWPVMVIRNLYTNTKEFMKLSGLYDWYEIKED